MKFVLFGATGGTGREVLKQALQKGYQVTAFVRNPEKLHIKDKNFIPFKGDATNIRDVENAIKGSEAVISTLGVPLGSKHIADISQSTKNIVEVMQKLKVKRLIFQSAFGVGDSYSKANIFQKLIFKTVMKDIFADKLKQEEYIKKSNLDWTIVRPTTLTKDEKKGQYQTGLDIKLGIYPHISRADVADFLLKQLNDDTFLHQTPTITY